MIAAVSLSIFGHVVTSQGHLDGGHGWCFGHVGVGVGDAGDAVGVDTCQLLFSPFLQRGRDLHWRTPLPTAHLRDTLPAQRLQFNVAMGGEDKWTRGKDKRGFGDRLFTMTVGSKCRKSPIDGGKDGGSSGRARGYVS
jgi:hypothetical protein